MTANDTIKTATRKTVYKCPHCVYEGQRLSWDRVVNGEIDNKKRCPRCESMVRLPDPQS